MGYSRNRQKAQYQMQGCVPVGGCATVIFAIIFALALLAALS